MSDDHECRKAQRCKARVRNEDGKFRGAGVERANTLCKLCEESAFAAMRLLGDDYRALDESITEARDGADQGPYVKRAPGSPSLIRLDVDSTMAAIHDEVLRWALRITKGDPLPRNPVEEVDRCVTILGAATGTLVDMPKQRVSALMPHPDGGDHDGYLELDGVDAVLRLAELHHRALSVLGVTEARIWLRDPCPHCGKAALSPSKDQKRVTCQSCRVTWDAKQFAWLCNVLESERES